MIFHFSDVPPFTASDQLSHLPCCTWIWMPDLIIISSIRAASEDSAIVRFGQRKVGAYGGDNPSAIVESLGKPEAKQDAFVPVGAAAVVQEHYRAPIRVENLADVTPPSLPASTTAPRRAPATPHVEHPAYRYLEARNAYHTITDLERSPVKLLSISI